jgi:catechol 2,3-dioxygenase-like lactoylglutathione lyase family enzyme
MDAVVTGLHVVTIYIPNTQKARAFYRDLLGLRERSFNEERNRAMFALPETSTLLTMPIQGPGEGGREPETVTGLIFRHPDPAAACEEIQRRGGHGDLRASGNRISGREVRYGRDRRSGWERAHNHPPDRLAGCLPAVPMSAPKRSGGNGLLVSAAYC